MKNFNDYEYQNFYKENGNKESYKENEPQDFCKENETQDSYKENINHNFYTQGGGNDPYNYKGKPSKPARNRTLAMVLAAVLAAGVISAGSIAAYSLATGTNNKPSAAATASSSKETENTTEGGAISLSNTKSKALSTSEVAKKVLPSVVGIKSQFEVQQTQNNMFSEFFGDQGQDNTQTENATATGTGIIYSSDGYIVTNAHVIYDSEYNGKEAKKVTVLMNDDNNTEYDAKVVAYDTDADLAVLKIEADGLKAAEFGNSDSLQVGDDVVAIGNPLGLDLTNTVTSGIISGLNRNITINDTTMTLIQTDAAINSGNSGGPLIDMSGKVIGINSSKMSSNYQGSASIEGIGFAIPSDTAASVVNDLIKHGYVTGKPQIGITAQDVSESVSNTYGIPQGVYVVSVKENGAAEKAGLAKGDIITAVNGTKVSSYEDLAAIKNKYKAGDTITLTIWKSGSTKDVKLTLDEANSENQQTEEKTQQQPNGSQRDGNIGA